MRYLTNDLAKLLGVTTNTVRRYEQSGFLKPKRDKSNYRWYESYDIDKAAMIRLYIKCGFSHDEIRAMINSSSADIANICTEKLDEIDGQIERLKRLRHWLKDNVQLMNTVQVLKDNFVIMKCPALCYVTFSIGDEILNERERLKTINYFMYQAPEVQLVNIYKKDEILGKKFTAHTGWAVKETDIEKFGMADMVKNNKYIEYYPSIQCLYGAVEISAESIYSEKSLNKAKADYFEKVRNYIEKNNYELNGDLSEILVNAFGEKVSMLMCMPIKKKGSKSTPPTQ